MTETCISKNYQVRTSINVSAVIFVAEATSKELRVSDATNTVISWDSFSNTAPLRSLTSSTFLPLGDGVMDLSDRALGEARSGSGVGSFSSEVLSPSLCALCMYIILRATSVDAAEEWMEDSSTCVSCGCESVWCVVVKCGAVWCAML